VLRGVISSNYQQQQLQPCLVQLNVRE
jgi:hypothetical protein